MTEAVTIIFLYYLNLPLNNSSLIMSKKIHLYKVGRPLISAVLWLSRMLSASLRYLALHGAFVCLKITQDGMLFYSNQKSKSAINKNQDSIILYNRLLTHFNAIKHNVKVQTFWKTILGTDFPGIFCLSQRTKKNFLIYTKYI